MAALRGLLRWQRCRLYGSGGGPELAYRKRLWRLSAGSGSDGSPSGLGVAAAGAAGGALAWFFCQRFYDRPCERELTERSPLMLGRGGGVGGPGQGHGLLPIPVAAAAKETTNPTNFKQTHFAPRNVKIAHLKSFIIDLKVI